MFSSSFSSSFFFIIILFIHLSLRSDGYGESLKHKTKIHRRYLIRSDLITCRWANLKKFGGSKVEDVFTKSCGRKMVREQTKKEGLRNIRWNLLWKFPLRTNILGKNTDVLVVRCKSVVWMLLFFVWILLIWMLVFTMYEFYLQPSYGLDTA